VTNKKHFGLAKLAAAEPTKKVLTKEKNDDAGYQTCACGSYIRMRNHCSTWAILHIPEEM